MFTLLRLPLMLGILTLLSPGLDQVRIEHRAGLAYEMRVTRTMSMRLGEVSMKVDGQEFPADLVKGAVPDRDDIETVVLQNVVQKVEEGRPVRVVREFVGLSMQTTVAGETTDQAGALEGMKLVLERGADGDVEARFEEGVEQTVDAAYLDGHLMEHAIHRLMPEASVETGDSWKPDDDAVRALLLAPGPQYYELDQPAELPTLLEDQAEFRAEMTLRERVELDGVECFRLELQVDLTADLHELPREFSSGDRSEEGSLQVEAEHTGELWIAVESRFPVKLELESEWAFDVEMNVDQEGIAVQLDMELTANNASSREWEILE